MSISIVTATLQDLVSKAVKGSSMIPAIPLTCLMEIKVKDGILSVSTTDNVNHLTVFTKTQASDFEAVVDSKLFAALVARLTTTNTSLSIEENKLIIEANGKYNMVLAVDSDGTFVKFPEPEIVENQQTQHITPEEVRSILTLNKSCKAEIKELPSIYNYYLDEEKVLTTDFYKVCFNPIKVFNNPTCLPPALLELVPYICDDKGVTVSLEGENVMFSSSIGKLCGKHCSQEELNDFPVEGLMKTINEGLPYTCKINRTLLMNAIDRICLFVDAYTNNKISIIFNHKQIILHSDTTNSTESIIYLSELDPQTPEVSLNIDALFFKNQLSACNKEDLSIKFGSDSGIQILCDKVNLVLGVLDEEG